MQIGSGLGSTNNLYQISGAVASNTTITIGGKTTHSANDLGIHTDASTAHTTIAAAADIKAIMKEQQQMSAAAGTVITTSQQVANDIAANAVKTQLAAQQVLADPNSTAEEKAQAQQTFIQAQQTQKDWSTGGKYNLALMVATGLTVDIQPSASSIVATVTVASRTYDGTNVATITGCELSGFDPADTVTCDSTGATATLSHGTAEFVAQEEMSRNRGYWWSPDTQTLLVQQTDEAGVEVRHVADPLHPEVTPTRFFYPRAGTPNAVVRLLLVPREGGKGRIAATEIMLNSPIGVALTKEGMWSALEIPGLQAAIDLENRQQIMASFSEDAAETRRARSEKRAPRYES